MSHTRKTTEFSTHLSRSRMRRYLHGQLDAKETHQTELHLANCTHCSAVLVDYIETEESDQYNTYAKQLSGKLKEQKISKRPVLSTFQTRALRASAAVVTLLIFSFFGVKTIINKEVNEYQADAATTSITNKVAVVGKKKPVEKKADDRVAENRPTKVETNAKKATPAKKAETTEKKAKVSKPANKPATQPVQTKKVEKAKSQVSVPNETKKVEEQSEPVKSVAKIEEKDAPAKIEKTATDIAPQETAQEAEAPSPVKTLPTVKKMDASKKIEISKPVSNTTPQVAPIPGGRLR